MQQINYCQGAVHIFPMHPNDGDRCKCGLMVWANTNTMRYWKTWETAVRHTKALVRRKGFKLIIGGKES